MSWPFAGRRERLRRHASDWIAKLNGPHDAGDVAAFERWYSAHADNAAAYDRLAALFEVAEDVRPAEVAPPPAHRGAIRPVRYALAAAAAVGVVLLAYVVVGARQAVPSTQRGVQIAVFTAAGTEDRRIVLRDGSEVMLSPGSKLEVNLGARERRLRLTAGEGRFTVFHEARPFIVAADGAEVLARGTQFVVRLGEGGMLVSLIEGRLEVVYPPARNGGERRVASLIAGERLVMPPSRERLPASTELTGVPSGPAMIVFDDIRLGEAIEAIDGSAAGRIRLADPALAERRITGAFRVGDTEAFAQGVTAALDLEAARGADGSLWLSTASDGAAAN